MARLRKAMLGIRPQVGLRSLRGEFSKLYLQSSLALNGDSTTARLTAHIAMAFLTSPRFRFIVSAPLLAALLLTLCLPHIGFGEPWPSSTQPVLWLKADSLSMADGERVSTWPDSSGNGRHATHSPGVPTFRRDVLNGYPVLRFADNMLKVPSVGDYRTLFLVYRMNRQEHWTDQAILWHPGADNDSTFAGGFVFGRSDQIRAGFPGGLESTAYQPGAGVEFDLVSAVATSEATILYATGAILQNLSSSSTGPSSASNLILGIRSDGLGSASHIGTFAHFDIAELLLYPTTLPEEERQKIEDYLHQKYWGTQRPAFSDQILAAQPGDIINIPDVDYNGLPHVSVSIERVPNSPQLLFSDRPEYFRSGDGIAMQENASPGTVRLYTYHVPTEAFGNKVITSVIENLGTEPLTLRFTRYAFPNPSGHYLLVGKQGLEKFFTGSNMPPERTLAPGDLMPVDVSMDSRQVWFPQLVHGFYEFDIDQPARITVLQRPPEMSNADAVANLPELPRILPGQNASGAGRGSFTDSNLLVTNAPETVIDTAAGNQRLVIADGNRDPWIVGWDSIEEVYEENKGNYGVVYRLRLKRTSSDGRGLAAFMHNLYPANNFCRHQAGAVLTSRGVHDAGLVQIPRNQVTFSEPGDNVLLQVFPPLEPGASEIIELVYSPPGASCLPTPLLFLPIDFPRAEAATFDGWRHRAGFSPDDLEDSDVTGWHADPGGFQIPNSLRYAFGLDPHHPDRHSLPRGEIRAYADGDEAVDYFTLTFRRLRDQWDFEYMFESSKDLRTWAPAEVLPVSTTPIDENLDLVTVRETSPLHGAEKRFLRIRIARGSFSECEHGFASCIR